MVSTYLKSRNWEPGLSSRRLMEMRLQKHSLSMIMVSQTGWRHCSLGWFGTENVNKNILPLYMYNVIGFAQLFWAAHHATPNPHPTQAHKLLLVCYQQQYCWLYSSFIHTEIIHISTKKLTLHVAVWIFKNGIILHNRAMIFITMVIFVCVRQALGSVCEMLIFCIVDDSYMVKIGMFSLCHVSLHLTTNPAHLTFFFTAPLLTCGEN